MNNNEKSEFDVVIIGSGPGGYVAAIRAAQLGLKAVVIERGKPGGVCLNIGCIPSKSLIHQASIYQAVKGLAAMGVKADLSGFDYRLVYEKSRAAADRLSKGVRFLLDKNKVPVITDEAIKILPGEVVTRQGQRLKTRNILVATGSRPRELPGFAFDEQQILSSTGAVMLQSLPKSLLIIGSGAIGVEFAHLMNAFGVNVHLVEILDRVLPLEDDEIAGILAKSFQKRGIRIETGTRAVDQQMVDGQLQVTLEKSDKKQQSVTVDQILVSAGRVPNTADLGLQDAGVRIDEGGFIVTGDYYQTDVPGIYAIGDVIRSPMLAHVASHEGIMAIEHMAGRPGERRLDPLSLPAATYCEPQIASFGYSERLADSKGIPYKKATFPFRGNGKAVTVEQAEGLVKVLTDPATGEILGGHVVGPEATELIHELLLARKAELLPEDLATMVHAHPTLSEAVMEVMLATDGQAIHF